LQLKKTYSLIALFISVLPCNICIAQKAIKTDVLIIGAGASGTAAAIQSARLGVNTILIAENTWLGGMITAAGVSAFDGNHNLPSGLFAEFREQLYKVYGGPNKVATGWVSNTLFEPHVGDSIFKAMVSPLKNLTILHNHQFVQVLLKNNTVKGAIINNLVTNTALTIQAKVTIDATELGDVMAAAKIPYSSGMEGVQETLEAVNVPASNDIIQDLTYVAILQDYGKGADVTVEKPANYNSLEFNCCCTDFCNDTTKLYSRVNAQKMLDYGKLPNNKYMINWPANGNDIYLNIIERTPAERQVLLQQAKNKTLRFIYFIQTQLGFKNLGLAKQEYPTSDNLPLIPYHREARRLLGKVRFTLPYISAPFSQVQPLYKTGIAVGDYPIDHHHRENAATPKNIGFPAVPSYNLPLGTLIPPATKGIIVAEKAISVSNIVNGTTRLQPVVVLIGQAAGALAALSVTNKSTPIKVAVRQVQQVLLNSNAYIMPYFDVPPTHPQFVAIQKIGATGILRGTGQPYQWANRTWFYPDSAVSVAELINTTKPYFTYPSFTTNYLTVANTYQIINAKATISSANFEAQWYKLGLKNFNPNNNITRAQFAVVINHFLQPFEQPINHNGFLIKNKN
jgi:hypothetical protein